VSRTTVLVLVAMGAALAGFALTTTSRRADDDPAATTKTAAAGPQRAALGWREVWGERGEQLVFSVETLEILKNGWRARIAIENRASTSYEVSGTLAQPFGLMVFASGDFDELTTLNESGTLPAVRPATRYRPELPALLEPGQTWSGTISAPGAIVANSWIRVVFGALVSVVPPREILSWISDHTYRLRR
jgi:hypothetical protein